MKIIDLSGEYRVYNEEGSVDTKIMLPGSSCEAKIGKKQEYYTEYCKESVKAPRERYEYVGRLFYEREFELPENIENSEISLFFERINMASKVWIDGVEIGRGVIGLSTPHVYKLTDRRNFEGKPLITLTPGTHSLKLMIDNSDFLHVGDMASGYSLDTQGHWNGCIGRMELIIKPMDNIESVSVFSEEKKVRVHTVLHTDRHIPMKTKSGILTYQLYDDKGKLLKELSQDIELYSSRQRTRFSFEHPFSKEDLWSEHSHKMFSLKVTLTVGDTVDEKLATFGVRTIKVQDKRFMLNEKPLSLRGTINCAQYPLTGYPPMDVKAWEADFSRYKEYGLNHVRFHAFCPPEAAFAAADRLGIYLSVEMPLWLNYDVTPLEFGDDEWHEIYFRDEALKINEWYGNHPSFCFFSNGNENLGDYAMLETIIEELKARDNRRLYTLTSNFDHPLSEVEDYQCAFEICHMRVRNQTRHAEVAKGTHTDYSAVVEKSFVPFTSFEVGQYCVYPDVDICEDYTGNMLPVNFEMIRKLMKEAGVYHRKDEFIEASGRLALRLYKEDVEAVLRTERMGGFQLLALIDYTGQSTATVGLLDIFHRDKCFVKAEDFRAFCNDVVPLFSAKRVFENTENLEADIWLYDFGKEPVINDICSLTLTSKDKVLFETELSLKEGKVHLSKSLDFVKENTEIIVSVSIKDRDKLYKNEWRIFVYAKEEPDEEAVFVNTKEELEEAVSQHRFVIATPKVYNEENLSKGTYIPVFWSPVHFKTDRNCGGIINEKHPSLETFPTDRYFDYQWTDLIENSLCLKYKGLEGVEPIVDMVPNFVDNVEKAPLCEYEYKGQKILFCGFDLSKEELPVKALKNSLISYAKKMNG